jgi:hypothetical protein
MAMTLKQELLLIWVLAVLAMGFAARHFLGSTLCVFQNLVAFELVGLHGAAKLGAFFLGAHI